jgi:hypothetical protein
MTFATRRVAARRGVSADELRRVANGWTEVGYLPENRVERFSTNAIAPSRKSSLPAISRWI